MQARPANVSEFGEQRRLGRRPRAIVQGKILVPALQRSGHRQQRRDADAAGDQNVALTFGAQRKIVPRRRDMHLTAFTQVLVDPDRPSTARRLALDGNLVSGAVVRIAAQRVLPHAAIRHAQIHMRAGGPFRKGRPKRMNELHVQNIRRCEPHLLDTQLHDETCGHWSSNSMASPGRMMPPRSMPQFRPERL